MALQFAAIAISFLYVNSLVNEAGGMIASAVSGVGGRLHNIYATVANSVGTAASAMVGQNIAARKIERVKKITMTTIAGSRKAIRGPLSERSSFKNPPPMDQRRKQAAVFTAACQRINNYSASSMAVWS